jgi:hypothetical protein
MTQRRTVTEQAATAAIEQGCRMLRLPTIRDRFSDIAAAAEREQLSYLGFCLSWYLPNAMTAPAAAPTASARPGCPANMIGGHTALRRCARRRGGRSDLMRMPSTQTLVDMAVRLSPIGPLIAHQIVEMAPKLTRVALSELGIARLTAPERAAVKLRIK